MDFSPKADWSMASASASDGAKFADRGYSVSQEITGDLRKIAAGRDAAVGVNTSNEFALPAHATLTLG